MTDERILTWRHWRACDEDAADAIAAVEQADPALRAPLKRAAIAALDKTAHAFVAWERARLDDTDDEASTEDMQHGNRVFWTAQFARLALLGALEMKGA